MDEEVASSQLHVREMQLGEISIRIDYFHNASDDHLLALGVDRRLLLPREAWREFYEADHARPIEERENYSLVWELSDQIVGFSSADHIAFGEQAFMHLHILDPDKRRSGMGVRFVRLSAATYFRTMELQRLYCQPNAFNVAPTAPCKGRAFATCSPSRR